MTGPIFLSISVFGRPFVQELSSTGDGRPFSHNRNGPKEGVAAFIEGSWVPMNTMWPWPRYTSVPIKSAILIHPAVWPQQTWANNWGGAPFTLWPGPRPTSVASGILNRDLSSRLATTDMDRKLKAVPLLGQRELVSIWHNVAGAEAYLRAQFHIHPSNRLAIIQRRLATLQTDGTDSQQCQSSQGNWWLRGRTNDTWINYC